MATNDTTDHAVGLEVNYCSLEDRDRWSPEPTGYGWVCDLETVKTQKIDGNYHRLVERGNLRQIGQMQGVDAWAYLEARYRRATKEAVPSASNEDEAVAESPDERSEEGDVAEAVSRLLEEKRKHCGDTFSEPGRGIAEEETTIEARPCRCKSWFCDGCCESKGIALRNQLIPILETFTSVQMWTLTIDPTLFSGPEEAFRYFKDKRCLGELMKALRKLGVLHSDRFFYVIEWHQNGYAHWHLLIDASYVPKETVQDIWDRFRPAWAGPKPDDRPGFGMVRFSRRKFASKRHAAQYATKYLIKPPRSGYPDWVLDYGAANGGQIRRYGRSGGLFPDQVRLPPEPEQPEEACPDGNEENQDEREWKDPGLVRLTIRERRERCGSQTVLVARHNRVYEDGSRESVIEFLGVLKNVSYEDSKEICGLGGYALSSIPLTEEAVKLLHLHDVRRKLDFRLSLIGN